VQKAYLLGGMILAGEFDKPVIIHCVRSYPELIFLKKRFAPAVNALIHGYNNNVQIFEQLLKHGCYISLGLAGLKRADVRAYIRRKPEILHRICLETDDSELTIEDIYNQAAQAFGMDVEKLCRLMKKNFISFFKVEDSCEMQDSAFK
jgi:TatD DNase family protein